MAIRLIAMGGTIAFGGAEGGAILEADSVALAAGVHRRFRVDPVDLATSSSIALGEEQLRGLIDEIERSRRLYDGVVVTHGTDTMEESAYFAALTLEREGTTIVFTGAMRHRDAVGFDGDANLDDALAVASQLGKDPLGPVVVMNGQIHAARFATKRHTTSLNAFVSVDSGPIGEVSEGHATVWFAPSYEDFVAELGAEPLPPVMIIDVGLGMDAHCLDNLATTAVRGVVINGFGGGHVPPSWLSSIDEALTRDIAIVMSSRCGAGATLVETYGVPGTEIDLRARGVVMAGRLSPAKTRLRLAVALAAGLSPAAVFPVW